MVEMKDSWLRSKKKQLDVQHHRERLKTGITMSEWKLTVEIISIKRTEDNTGTSKHYSALKLCN